MLPNKDETLGFRRLVLDRQRAFMAMELVHLRDQLMSSDALIALAQQNGNVPCDCMTEVRDQQHWAQLSLPLRLSRSVGRQHCSMDRSAATSFSVRTR